MNIYQVLVKNTTITALDGTFDWLHGNCDSYMYSNSLYQDGNYGFASHSVYTFGAEADAIMCALRMSGEVTRVEI